MMSPVRRNAAILFADISGSTTLYDKLGNEQALQIVSRTLGILTREMALHQGSLIKTIGDEVMCMFPDIPAAINAACAMQHAVDKQVPGGDQPIYVRIGVHYGEVVLEGSDVFGDTVNVAARVTAITRARQIMTAPSMCSRSCGSRKTRPARASAYPPIANRPNPALSCCCATGNRSSR
jgi:class 3 adenylate cyclase